jgi:hypothetical protein
MRHGKNSRKPDRHVGTQIDLSSEGSRSQAHQIERGTPQEPVWVAEGLRQFEVVVVLSHKQLHRQSRKCSSPISPREMTASVGAI